MKKIPSLFIRDGASLTREYNPEALWVLSGEGTPTRKWDGTAVRWANNQLWSRYDVKNGKPLPPGFVPCQEPDPITGHHPGWVPATRPEDKWIREAAGDTTWQNWTYEACGPKIGANAEQFDQHTLIRHGGEPYFDCSTNRHPSVPTSYDELIDFFVRHNIEGIVWWRDLNDLDCDKAKITGAALGVNVHPNRQRKRRQR